MGKKMEELRIIKECKNLVIECYNLTKDLPDSEKFGLISQMQRCSVSIGSNIIEGKSRSSNKDILKFLYIARGSLNELRFQNDIVKEIYSKQINDELLNNIGRMLSGLIRYHSVTRAPNSVTRE